MFFPKDPVQAVESAGVLTLNRLAVNTTNRSATVQNVTQSGLLTLNFSLMFLSYSAGLSVTGVLAPSGFTEGVLYNSGNPVTLLNLSGTVPQNQRMILPSGANTVLGNNQWAEFIFVSSQNVWRVLL